MCACKHVYSLSINQSINQSNYWFNVQTFICEDDSDAQKKQISRRMQPQKFSLKQLFETPGRGCATSVRWQPVPNNRSRVSESSRGLGSGRFWVFQKMLIAGSQRTSIGI